MSSHSPMRLIIDELPQQAHTVFTQAGSLTLKDKQAPIHRIVFVGMGGSGISSRILTDCMNDHILVPWTIIQDYRIPHWVDRYTLVIAVSYSGNTEETLQAYQQAHTQGALCLGISSGGRLQQRCKDYKHDHILIPQGYPPRGAIVYSYGYQLAILGYYGLLDCDRRIGLSWSSLLTHDKEIIVAHAETIAPTLHKKIPILYVPYHMQSLGIRARQQLNENSKILCRHHHYPESNHNENLGWMGGDDRFVAYFMTDPDNHPQNHRRVDLSASWIRSQGAHVHILPLSGQTIQERLWWGIRVWDYVSVIYADMYGIDAMDITCIEEFKRRLKSQ